MIDDDGVTVLEAVIVVIDVRDCDGVPEFEPVGVGDGDDERLFVVDKVLVSEAVCDDDDVGVTVLEAVIVALEVRDCDGVPEFEPVVVPVGDGDGDDERYALIGIGSKIAIVAVTLPSV